MKAMVLALAASVGESVAGQWWRQAGEVLDIVIPIALFITVVVGGCAVFFNLVH